jgi:hypothetical protein
MPESKSTNTDPIKSASVAAVMPCVGGFIYWVAQSGIDARAEYERQYNSEIPAKKDTTGAARECVD